MPGGYFGPEQFINGPMKEEPFKTQFEQFYQRMLNDSSKIVTTVCSGGAVLANTSAIDNTSVIDDRTATTNKDSWAWIYYQADWFQKVGLKYEARWNRDSNLLTSSGVSSGMDAAMWLLENLYGHELRANVSKYLSFNDVYQSRRRNTEDEWRFAAWWSLPNTTQGHCEDWYAIGNRGLCDPTCKERCQDWHANMTRDSCKERCKSVFVEELANSDQYAQQHGFDGKYSAFYYQVPLRHGNGNELLNGSLNKNQTEREGETISRCHKDCEQWYPDAAKLKEGRIFNDVINGPN